jgi:hypothetical protein
MSSLPACVLTALVSQIATDFYFHFTHLTSLYFTSAPHFHIHFTSPPPITGAEIRSVCTEAGMYAIRARRKVPPILPFSLVFKSSNTFFTFQIANEKDFLDAINKVIKGNAKFSATPRYMTYN